MHHTDKDLEIDIEPPSKAEIVLAIKSLRNGKAPGQDGLNAELLKTDPEFASQILQPLLRNIWVKKEIPDDLLEGVIIKIPKKGNLRDCNNWHEITLLSIRSKIKTKIIVRRLTEAVDEKLDERTGRFP